MMRDPRSSSNIIFLALLMGQLGFFSVATVLERSVMPLENVPAEVLFGITTFFVVASFTASHFLGIRLLEQARMLTTESERLSAGLRAMVIRLALLEGAGMLTIVFYLLTGEQLFIWLFGFILIGFVLRKPNDAEWDSLQRGS